MNVPNTTKWRPVAWDFVEMLFFSTHLEPIFHDKPSSVFSSISSIQLLLLVACIFTRDTLTGLSSTFTIMGDELDKDQIAILQKAFDSFAQGKGYITPEMVGTILRVMGQAFNEQTLRELIAEVDEDGSGQIEFAEFVILASKFIVEEDEETLHKELKEAFRLYDKAGNGYIPTTSLKEILKELDDKLSPEDLEGIVNEIDEDGSGTVDFNEFMEMMTG